MTLASGSRLGPYEVVAPLGAGGMGEVYRARDTRLDREVAIKVLPAEVANDPERLRRFDQEAKAVSALNHQNILTVHDVGAESGTSFLVTELLRGESFRELIRKGPLPPRRAVELALQVAKGLAAAHEKGIVHRDLKPENLFLTDDGVVKILDFGLARLATPIASGSQLAAAPTVEALTGAGMVVGTVGYMSPEQVRGESADARADLFAFGCVLYELLVGRRAFSRESAVDTLHAILHDDPTASAGLAPTLPPELVDLLGRCLEKRRDRRFQSAADLVFALQHLESASHVDRARSSPGRWRGVRWISLAAGSALAILLVLSVVAERKSSARTTTRVERIAVLPFLIAGDADETLEPIAEGLTQGVIHDLSRLPGLRVTPWMTVRRFADSRLLPEQLAAEMGVQALLTTDLRRHESTIRVDLALVDGRSGFQTWGDGVEAADGDFVLLRSRVARALTNALRPELTDREATLIAKPVAKNPEAYELALRAQHLLRVQNRASLEAADGLVRRSLALDSNLALAHLARAQLEFARYYFGWDGDLRNLELAASHGEEAIRLDPDETGGYEVLIQVHWIGNASTSAPMLEIAARLRARGIDSAERLVVFAEAYRYAGLDAAAIELYRRALAHDPANELALQRLGMTLGSNAEGIAVQELAVARFGETARRRLHLGLARSEAGDLQGAEADLRRALELSPDDLVAFSRLGVVLARQGRRDEAMPIWSQGLALTEKMIVASPGNDRLHGFALDLAALLGDRRTVEREERILRASVNRSRFERETISLGWALLGEDDRAFALATSDEGAKTPEWFEALPTWGLERLARDPRYRDVMTRRAAREAELLARFPID